MAVNRGVGVTKNSYCLMGVTFWSFIFMTVFCFVGCTAGSCLSYGHSCWGAHGKRSGNSYGPNNLRSLSIREDNEEGNRNIVSPSVNDHWMLQRLVTKRHQIPSSGKYRMRWFDVFRGRGLPRDWDNSGSIISKEENDIIRGQNEESEEESKEPENFSNEVTESLTDEDSAEIILLPRRKESNDQARHLQFIKIMRSITDGTTIDQ